MDFSNFDERAKAEKGAWFDILHPDTFAPMGEEGSDRPRVKVMSAITDKAQKVLDKVASKVRARGNSPTLSDTYADNVEGAIGLILEFDNVVIEGKPLDPKDTAAVRKWLNYTFPKMAKVNGVVTMVNKPFANQIHDNAMNHEAHLGNAEA